MQADLVEASAGQPIDPVALLANVTIWDCRTSGGQAAIGVPLGCQQVSAVSEFVAGRLPVRWVRARETVRPTLVRAGRWDARPDSHSGFFANREARRDGDRVKFAASE